MYATPLVNSSLIGQTRPQLTNLTIFKLWFGQLDLVIILLVFQASIQLIRLAVAIRVAVADLVAATMLLMLRLVSLLSLFM
jgi:hypothetical protein